MQISLSELITRLPILHVIILLRYRNKMSLGPIRVYFFSERVVDRRNN